MFKKIKIIISVNQEKLLLMFMHNTNLYAIIFLQVFKLFIKFIFPSLLKICAVHVDNLIHY